jgi:hypothetical protein
MTQQMFSFDVPRRSFCAVYDNNPLPVYTAQDNLRNAYRCAVEDMQTVSDNLAMWKRRLGLANKGKYGAMFKVATKAEIKAAKSECMTMINRLRAQQRRALAALGQAYDAISPVEATAVRRSFGLED